MSARLPKIKMFVSHRKIKKTIYFPKSGDVVQKMVTGSCFDMTEKLFVPLLLDLKNSKKMGFPLGFNQK